MPTKENKSKRRRKRLLFIGLELLAIIVVLILGEVYIRIRFPAYQMPNALKYEQSIFARSVFPQEAQTQGAQSAGFVQWPINAQGYRAVSDFRVAKAPGMTRIVMLGGSSVFDPYVWGEDDWPHRVERHLIDAGHDVEVINAGVPKHATFDSVGRLYSEIWQFEPDYIILYQCWNDIKYFTRLNESQSLLRSFRPLPEGGDPFSGCVNKLECFLVNRSQLYLWLRVRFLLWRYDVGAEGVVEERPVVNTIGETGPAQYKLDVQTFVDITRNIGATPILTTQARLVTADLSTTEQERVRYEYVGLSHDGLVDAFDTCDQITHEVAEEKDVEVIDLSSDHSGQPELFADHVHLTDEGSQAIAQAVAEYMDSVLTEDGGAE